MDLKNKIVLAHKGYFDRESTKEFRENSKEVCAISGAKDYISVIELDLRKSKDGILYCYHGSFVSYYTTLKISRPFFKLKERFGINSLEDILEVIPAHKILFLDIKDSNITRKDILQAFENKKFVEVILGNKSFSFSKRFSNMPKEFVKCFNGNLFCNFYSLAKLKSHNYKYFEVVFPFQVRKKVIKKVEDSGMEFRCAGLFFASSEQYWNTINKYNIRHVSSDFINKVY